MSSSLSIAAIAVSVVSVAFTGGSWLIQWKQWMTTRKPKIEAVYEEYGGPDYAFVEFTNKGEEDLAQVEIKLQEMLEGIIPALMALLRDQVHATGETTRLAIGPLAALQTKRARILRNQDVIEGQCRYIGGEADFYAHCKGYHWWQKWRVLITVSIPGWPHDDMQ